MNESDGSLLHYQKHHLEHRIRGFKNSSVGPLQWLIGSNKTPSQSGESIRFREITVSVLVYQKNGRSSSASPELDCQVLSWSRSADTVTGRMSMARESSARKKQAGFQPGWSCTDQIPTLYRDDLCFRKRPPVLSIGQFCAVGSHFKDVTKKFIIYSHAKPSLCSRRSLTRVLRNRSGSSGLLGSTFFFSTLWSK